MNDKNDNGPLLWNYHSKHGIFRREEYYFGFLCLICISMVTYCKSDFYSYGLEQILEVGKKLSRFYLGMSTIMDGSYDIRTKEFYSLFYLFVPIYFIIGLLDIFFISPYRYKKMFVDMNVIKLIFAFFLAASLALLPMLAPMVGFNAPILLTIFNAIMTAGIMAAAGAMLTTAVIKLNISRS